MNLLQIINHKLIDRFSRFNKENENSLAPPV